MFGEEIHIQPCICILFYIVVMYVRTLYQIVLGQPSSWVQSSRLLEGSGGLVLSSLICVDESGFCQI